MESRPGCIKVHGTPINIGFSGVLLASEIGLKPYTLTVSDRDIELGYGTRFERSIYAAGELRLKAGVHGEGPGAVAVFARSRVLLGDDILVRGRIASEGSVVSA